MSHFSASSLTSSGADWDVWSALSVGGVDSDVDSSKEVRMFGDQVKL